MRLEAGERSPRTGVVLATGEDYRGSTLPNLADFEAHALHTRPGPPEARRAPPTGLGSSAEGLGGAGGDLARAAARSCLLHRRADLRETM